MARGKRRGTEKRQLGALLGVRTTPAMKAALEERAAREGITPNSLARTILANALPVDPREAVAIPARVPAFAPPPGIVHELAHARETAAEAVGMLVQASRRYREMGMAETHADAEAVLRTMRMAAAELLDLSADIAREWRAFLASQDGRMVT